MRRTRSKPKGATRDRTKLGAAQVPTGSGLSSSTAEPKRRDYRVVLVAGISTVIALFLAEGCLRLFTDFGPGTRPAPVSPAALQPAATRDASYAVRYVQGVYAAPGTDRRWFLEDPPPLPNRTKPSKEAWARFEDYQRRGLFAWQSAYLWNRNYVEANRCSPVSIFRNFPERVLAFEPPEPSVHPIYRFPPDTTTVDGLVTNAFGLRGPPLALQKPPKAVRIAFLGASTTIDAHNAPFSYPEHVVHWLNRYAGSNRYDVRFEVLNSGREGINSEDISVILQRELLPLNPDLAVYYEGANQFTAANLLVRPAAAPRRNIQPDELTPRHPVPRMIRTHSALGNLLDQTLTGFGTIGEPKKPSYRLEWPAGIDENNPDIDDLRLPLQLHRVLADLDAVNAAMRHIGGQLAVCSFQWFAFDGMRLSPVRHEHIYEQLNTVLWPLRYGDIRRLTDFQNCVLRRYSEDRKVPFMDVASRIPRDPDLFIDAIHMTETGERLKAWIIFQQLVPVVKQRIEAGLLPRALSAFPLPAPPSLAIVEVSARCEDPTQPLTRVEGVLALDKFERANVPHATLQRGRPLRITTAPERFSYAAVLKFEIPSHLSGMPYILVRGRVMSGRIGVGLLDLKNNSFQVEKSVKPEAGWTDIYVPVSFAGNADQLVIRNAAEGNTRSEMLIEDVALVVAAKR